MPSRKCRGADIDLPVLHVQCHDIVVSISVVKCTKFAAAVFAGAGSGHRGGPPPRAAKPTVPRAFNLMSVYEIKRAPAQGG